MALSLVQWDSSKNTLKRGGSAPDFRCGTSAIGSSASSLTVTFGSALPNTSYSVIATWLNTAAAYPQQQPLIITAFSVNGFTVSWPAPTDVSTYSINWIVLPWG